PVSKRKRSKNIALNLQKKFDSLQHGQKLPIRKNTEPFYKSWTKFSTTQKAKIEPSVKYKDVTDAELPIVSADIDCTTQDNYKNWKNELPEHFIENIGDEKSLDLAHASRSVPTYMIQEHKMVELCTTQLQSQVSSFASDSLIHTAPARIDETTIADNVLGVRQDYWRGVGPKLKGATSTSSTTASPPQDPLILDTELRNFVSQTQSYLAATHHL
ncbi:hypothetical protein TorRG33x02_339990, partial [Trema orientale]